MIPKEDFGNLGNLVTYLNGNDPLKERLKKSEKIFFIPLRIPPQHKEEIVILWLIDIISSNKILKLSDEEINGIWRTLRRFLSSERLKALCSHNWICPLTSDFIQTLMSTISVSTTDLLIRNEAFLICECLLSMPSLSPQIMELSSRSLLLYTSLVSFLNKERLVTQLPLLKILIQETCFVLNHKMTKIKSFLSSFDTILFISFTLSAKLQENPSPKGDELLLDIEKLVMSTVFSPETEKIYASCLKLTLDKESKEQLSLTGEAFFAFLIKCLEHSERDISLYTFQMFTTAFFSNFKGKDIVYHYLINVMYLLEIDLKGILSVEKKSIAAQALTPVKLDILSRDQFLIAVLEALLNSNVFLYNSLKQWVKNVLNYYIYEQAITETSFKIVSIIIKLDPMFVVNSSQKNLFSELLSCDDINNFKLSLDDMLCEILDVHINLRTVHDMYKQLSTGILIMKSRAVLDSVSFHTNITYGSNQFIPGRFMKKLMNAVTTMGVQMWFTLFSSIHKFLSQSCHKALQTSEKDCNISGVSLVIWLSSCCLSAATVLDAAVVPVLSTELAKHMNALADDCILPLVKDMLAISKIHSALTSSILNLMTVWSEIHLNLLSSDTGYKETTNHQLRSILECESLQDFSFQIPFVNKEMWDKIFADFLDEDNDSYRFLIVNLMIQRLTLAQNQKSLNVNESESNKNLKSFRDRSFQYIVQKDDINSYPQTTQSVANHLPFLIPLMKPTYSNAVARMFVSGIENEEEVWIKFSRSSFFQGNSKVHLKVLSLIFSRFLALISGSKRKLDDEELEGIGLESKTKYFTQKVVTLLIHSLHNKNLQTASVCEIKNVFCYVEILCNSTKNHARLSRRSESEVLKLIHVLEALPLSLYKTSTTMTLVAFILCLLIEEGGLSGRKNVVCRLLHLLNLLTNSFGFRMLFKQSSGDSCLLIWLLKEAETLCENFCFEDSNLNYLLNQEECIVSMTHEREPLEMLVHFLCSLTESFIFYSDCGDKFLTYVKSIIELGKAAENSDSYSLAALILVTYLRKVLVNSKFKTRSSVREALTELGSWYLEMSAETSSLSKATVVSSAGCLATFALLLDLKNAMVTIQNSKKAIKDRESEPKESPMEMESIEDSTIQANEEVIGINNEKKKSAELDINWKLVLQNGLRLSDVVMGSENCNLKKFCFDFFVPMILFTKDTTAANDNVWDTVQKVFALISLPQVSSDRSSMKSLFQVLSDKQCGTFFTLLLEKTKKNPLDGPLAAQWLSVALAYTSANSRSIHRTSSIFEELISIMCVHMTNKSNQYYQTDLFSEWFKVFLAILESQCRISSQSKALLLHVCFNLTFVSTSAPSYIKAHYEYGKLLNHLMIGDYEFVTSRASSIMSAITHLTTSVIDLSNVERILDGAATTEVSKCCALLEKLMRDLKKYDYHFAKIIPFSLAKIIEKMQQTNLIAPVKASMDRVVYLLLDISDEYSLRHVLVTISPSVATLLKYLYQTYSGNFRFDPKID